MLINSFKGVISRLQLQRQGGGERVAGRDPRTGQRWRETVGGSAVQTVGRSSREQGSERRTKGSI